MALQGFTSFTQAANGGGKKRQGNSRGEVEGGEKREKEHETSHKTEDQRKRIKKVNKMETRQVRGTGYIC